MAKNQDELKAKIASKKRSIRQMENKRMRSLAAIVEALVDKTEPNETEVKIFKTMSRIIEGECDQLRLLQDELKQDK